MMMYKHMLWVVVHQRVQSINAQEINVKGLRLQEEKVRVVAQSESLRAKVQSADTFLRLVDKESLSEERVVRDGVEQCHVFVEDEDLQLCPKEGLLILHNGMFHAVRLLMRSNVM